MKNDLLKISICGDIMCLEEQLAAVSDQPNQGLAYNSIFEHVKPLFNDSDFVIGNLETPVCNADLTSESICFNTPVEFLKACKFAGFNFLTTANNHCLDRGVEGMEQTIENLDKLHLGHTGTYSTEQSSKEIAVVEVCGKKISIVTATFGTNSEVNGEILPADQQWRIDLLKKQNKPAKFRFDPSGEEGRKIIYDNVSSAAINNTANSRYIDAIKEKVKRAKRMADIVIFMPHIGGQYNPVPGKYTRFIIDEFSILCPDIIVAGHPHVPLRMQRENNVPCAYSLGNFSFTPEVGYYLPNVLAEYGIVIHTYWSKSNSSLKKITFSIIKNVVGEDGVSRVIPVSTLFSQLSSTLDKERLTYDAEAVATRFTTSIISNPFEAEITPPFNILIISVLLIYHMNKYTSRYHRKIRTKA